MVSGGQWQPLVQAKTATWDQATPTENRCRQRVRLSELTKPEPFPLGSLTRAVAAPYGGAQRQQSLEHRSSTWRLVGWGTHTACLHLCWRKGDGGMVGRGGGETAEGREVCKLGVRARASRWAWGRRRVPGRRGMVWDRQRGVREVAQICSVKWGQWKG